MSHDGECGRVIRAALLGACLATCFQAVAAAQAAQPSTRTSLIEQAQAEKAALQPYNRARRKNALDYAENYLLSGQLNWHPFFDSAYSGGGFTLGARLPAARRLLQLLDLRGSYHVLRLQADRGGSSSRRRCSAGRRRCRSSAGGGRRPRSASTASGSRHNRGEPDQLRLQAAVRIGGARAPAVSQRPAVCAVASRFRNGSRRQERERAVRSRPSTRPRPLAGLGAKPTYLHSQGTVGIDWRPAPGYARRGGFYGVTFHDFADTDSQFGFTQVDYEVDPAPSAAARGVGAVVSWPGRDDALKDDQQIPFFMLPALGGGSTLRGFSSWRFRDRNSLLLQAEWRIIVNRFLDMAVFYDAGQGERRTAAIWISTARRATTASASGSMGRSRRRCASISRRAEKASPSSSASSAVVLKGRCIRLS